MQLFAKTKSKESGGDFKPWHPNFRNASELPDTKTIRTRFFVNAGAVTFAFCGLLFLAYNEYAVRESATRLAQFEQQADSERKASAEAVSLNKQFKQQEQVAREYIEFGGVSPMIYTDFLLKLGSTLPDQIIVSSLGLSRTGVSIRGEVRGLPQEASGIASAFEKHLRETPEIASKFESIVLASLARDSNSGALSFEIVMRFPTTKGKK